MTAQSHVWNGVTYRILLDSVQSGGSLGLFESTDFPGYGPPRHVHHREDETFVVLEGEVEFVLGADRSMLSAGDTIFVPRGVEHTFRVRGAAPARMLTALTPGGMEGFFVEMAKGGYKIPEDMGQIVAIAARYQLEFTGPPLT